MRILPILIMIPFLLGASFTITIPDDKVQDVIEAYCKQYGYRETLEDGLPNPETKAQFTKRQIRRYIRDVYTAYKTDLAIETTRDNTIVQSETDTKDIIVE